MLEMSVSELARHVGGDLDNDDHRLVRGVAGIDAAGPNEATFLANRKYERYVASTQAAAVFVPLDYIGPASPTASLIRCEDPYFAFREAMVLFYGFRQHGFAGVDDRAVVDPTAEIASDATIGPLAVISAGVTVGARSVVYGGAYLAPAVRVGRECVIYPNVTLYDGVEIGDRVTIHAGSSIGQDGFGYSTHDGQHEKIPQVGGVVIEDDVEIGACCAIDRATIGSTVIGAGTKMSNLVAVGHGTRMGKHCLLVAQVGIAGSVDVGDYCVFAGQAGIAGHLRIGERARIAAKSGVSNDVPPGGEVLGIPAIPLPQARRSMMSFSRLPQMRTAIRRLTREVNALKRRLGLRPGEGRFEEDV